MKFVGIKDKFSKLLVFATPNKQTPKREKHCFESKHLKEHLNF